MRRSPRKIFLLKYEHAERLMRTGSRLVHMHTNGPTWFLVPGGPTTNEVATKLREHPAVIGGRDGLFPGLDQTWRMAVFVS